jgi:hypothetical protein
MRPIRKTKGIVMRFNATDSKRGDSWGRKRLKPLHDNGFPKNERSIEKSDAAEIGWRQR